MASRGAVPQNTNPNANPQTWDWQPVKVREALRRNELPRKCNDQCFAYALIMVFLAVIGFAIYGGMKVEWGVKFSKEEKNYLAGEFLWKIVLQFALASAFGMVFAFVWSCILRSCAGFMIKLSIFTYIGLKLASMFILISYGVMSDDEGSRMGMMIVSGCMGVMLLFTCLYFCCVWSRIPMAEATLTIAIGILHRYSKVMWISLAFSFLTILYIIGCVFGTFGLYHLLGMAKEGGVKEDGALEYVIWCGSGLILWWGTLTLSYIVHAICAGVVGTWYFGTSRKRTVTDAFIRAITTSLGSLSFAAFIVALIRMMEMIARDQKEKAAREGNAALMIIACMMQCILSMLGDLMNYLNGLAIVRVAVYGESFCTAAKRTMNMMKYRGMDQIINDDLSGMPVWLGCFIIYMLCVPCLFASYKFIGTYILLTADATTSLLWLYSFMFATCALFIPISILSTIPSFVQSLYVLWGDDPAAFDQVHPHEANMLKQAAYSYKGYRVRYDDNQILVQGRNHSRYA